MPAGVGTRGIMVLAGSQAPSSGYYSNFLYDAPTIINSVVLAQSSAALANGFTENAINTDGGTTLKLTVRAKIDVSW